MCRTCVIFRDQVKPAAAAILGNERMWRALDAELGLGLDEIYNNGGELPDELVEKLKGLAGPHGRTLYEVYKIQKGLK